MKKIITLALLLVLYMSSFSQDVATKNSESEESLLGVIGGFSAAYLLNTYELIDGLVLLRSNKLETDDLLTRKFNAQKNIIGVITKQVDKMIELKSLSSEADQQYTASLKTILGNLQKQLDLYVEYVKTGSALKKTEYDKVRDDGKKKLNTLLGIEE